MTLPCIRPATTAYSLYVNMFWLPFLQAKWCDLILDKALSPTEIFSAEDIVSNWLKRCIIVIRPLWLEFISKREDPITVSNQDLFCAGGEDAGVEGRADLITVYNQVLFFLVAEQIYLSLEWVKSWKKNDKTHIIEFIDESSRALKIEQFSEKRSLNIVEKTNLAAIETSKGIKVYTGLVNLKDMLKSVNSLWNILYFAKYWEWYNIQNIMNIILNRKLINSHILP